MLVLARKKGQRITIGEEIVIEVVDLTLGKVRLGITAPREVAIHREEIKALVDQERLEQGGSSGTTVD